MGPMDTPTTYSRLCAPHGRSRNESANGGRPVGSAHHGGIPLFSFFNHFSCQSVSHFWSFTFIHSSLLSLFFQAPQKICLANHIHSIVELLHADALHQLEVALLGSPAAKLLDILSMNLQYTPPIQHQAVPLPPLVVSLQPSATTSISPSPPPSLLWVILILRDQLKIQPLQVGCRQ